MAFTVTPRGTGSSNAAGQSTLVASPNATIADGRTLILCVAYDNSGTLGADPLTGISDSQRNAWSSDQQSLNDPGAANAGIVVRIFSALITNGPFLATATVTLTFSAVTVARAWAFYEVQAADGFWGAEANEGQAAQSSATPSITTASISSGNLVVACVGRAANGTRTADGDATSGTWSNPQNVGVGVGAAGAEIICETKILTATGTQTYNPTFGGALADGCNIWVARFEQARVNRPLSAPVYPQLLPQ